MSPYNSARKRPVFDQKALVARLLAGTPILLGEYRGTAAERIDYNDKTTGKAEFFIKIGHTIEVTKADGSCETLSVEERSMKGLDDAKGYVSGLVKGQRVALSLEGLQRVKGRVVATVPADDDAIAVLS